jgi:hypothetical protein
VRSLVTTFASNNTHRPFKHRILAISSNRSQSFDLLARLLLESLFVSSHFLLACFLGFRDTRRALDTQVSATLAYAFLHAMLLHINCRGRSDTIEEERAFIVSGKQLPSAIGESLYRVLTGSRFFSVLRSFFASSLLEHIMNQPTNSIVTMNITSCIIRFHRVSFRMCSSPIDCGRWTYPPRSLTGAEEGSGKVHRPLNCPTSANVPLSTLGPHLFLAYLPRPHSPFWIRLDYATMHGYLTRVSEPLLLV